MPDTTTARCAQQDMATLAEDVRRIFDPARFDIARLPVDVGALDHDDALSDVSSCLDMLVMLPGGSVTLPPEYASNAAIASFLDTALAFEDALLPDWRSDRHLYLTVDRRRVLAGGTHRNAGWHFDGMQGARYPDKLPACHQHLATTALPTEFSDRPVDATGLHEDRHNWFESLGEQVPDDHRPWTPEPLRIVCMSAYQLHRSPTATSDQWRTFLRLDVSCKQQDRLGNTLNPSLPAPFEYVRRSLPEGLSRPVRDSSWDGARRFDRTDAHQAAWPRRNSMMGSGCRGDGTHLPRENSISRGIAHVVHEASDVARVRVLQSNPLACGLPVDLAAYACSIST